MEIILGCNGMIWVAPQAEGSENGHAAGSEQQSIPNRTVTPQQRKAVCQVANAVRLLALLNMLIFPSSILNVCKVRSPTISIAC